MIKMNKMIQVITERQVCSRGQKQFKTYRFSTMDAASRFMLDWKLTVIDIIL